MFKNVRLTFAIFKLHLFLSLRPNPLILTCRQPPPCTGVAKGAGLGDCLKSCRGYLITNSRASYAYLGQAHAAERDQARTSTETPGREKKQGQRLARNAAAAVEGQGSTIVHRSLPAFMSALPSVPQRLTPISLPPFCLCLLVAVQQLWEEMKSKMSSHCTHLHPMCHG